MKYAIFDFDGTLFDSMFIWETLGEDYLRSLGKQPRPGLRDALRPMSTYQSACYLQRAYGLTLTPEEITRGINERIEDFYFHRVQPKPGVIPFLERLRQAGIPMAVATASERSHVEAALKRCGMDHCFDAILTCGDVGRGKDSPLVFRRAMEALGGDRAGTVIFEDALHGVRTAKADGFFVCGVYDPSEPRPEELKALCDCYLTDYFHTEPFWKFASAQ